MYLGVVLNGGFLSLMAGTQKGCSLLMLEISETPGFSFRVMQSKEERGKGGGPKSIQHQPNAGGAFPSIFPSFFLLWIIKGQCKREI